MLGKEYLDTARMLHRAALRMSDRAVASRLRALAVNCEQRAEKAVQADAAKGSVREGLKSFSRARLQAARAAQLAEGELEKIQDPAAPPQERAQRKRRLTKGPSEFRKERIDQPRNIFASQTCVQ
jgi:hypothetical protein